MQFQANNIIKKPLIKNKMEISSVEWLVANLDIDLIDKDWAINQAKEMEKQVNAEIRNNAIDNIIESFIDEFKSKIAPTMGVLIELDRLKDKYTNKEII